jgi:flagellin-like hook-associated protein FlgL
LKVAFNETATSEISISGVTFDAAGLGLVVSTNTWQTDKDIKDALATLTAALATLRGQATIFASNVSLVQAREEFTKSIINTLKSAADGLVVADQNEEGANLLALQTRQQLSTTALSLAAQADQNVLRVLGL